MGPMGAESVQLHRFRRVDGSGIFPILLILVVGDAGFEPATPAV